MLENTVAGVENMPVVRVVAHVLAMAMVEPPEIFSGILVSQTVWRFVDEPL